MNHKIMSTLLVGVLMWGVGAPGPAGVAAAPAVQPKVTTAVPDANPAPASPRFQLAPRAPTARSAHAHSDLGHTIDLTDQERGERIAATVVKVVDPASPAFGFDRAVLGQRLVGIEIQLRNTGSIPYSGSPDRGAVLVDRSGQVFRATFKSISAGGPFPGTLVLGPGQTRSEYVVFEVPKSSAVDTFQLTLATGSTAPTGKWSIAGVTGAAHIDPADLVKSYFGAINNGDCRAAWELGGRNLGQSYVGFATDFCGAARDRVTIISASDEVVRIRLDVEQMDGSHSTYAGTFLVRDGEIAGAQLQRM